MMMKVKVLGGHCVGADGRNMPGVYGSSTVDVGFML